ncbi:polysaccharide deacetylase family protein [Paenibacillus sp. YAF4_2]|uniref:polysaccharide deacetylase family protein n=1 Tax=Paenibacillus sp. YAF4_2 TaxID=3233085 RepID=UPI003F949111
MKSYTTYFFLLILILLTTGCEEKENPHSQIQAEEKQIQVLPINTKPVKMDSRVSPLSIPILMYHSIGINSQSTLFVPPRVFQEQMEYLKMSGYNTITFKDLKSWKKGEAILDKPILITFDDGYLDNFTIGYPILKRLEMKATIFITSDLVSSTNHLSWGQIKEMEESGFIEIGVHTRHHVNLIKQSPMQLKDEILGAKQKIEEKLGHETLAFAYPFGKNNTKVVKVVKNAGFEFAVTTLSGLAQQDQGLLTLHRIRITGNQSEADFELMFP